MTARARLDADRTAEPLTRIEHHPPHGGCISPYMPLVNPEYVGADGKRTPLSAPAEALPSLTPSEVALAKVLEALYDPSLEKSEDRAILRMVGQLRREVFSAGYDPRGFTGNALLDRARKAGVL